MKLYTEEQLHKAFEDGYLYHAAVGLTREEQFERQFRDTVYSLKPIELPSDEEIIGRFMNWFLKHYSTATIDGFFGYVNSLEEEVSMKEILDDYFNQNK